MSWAKFQEDILETQEDSIIFNKHSKPEARSFLSKVVSPHKHRIGYVKYNPIKKRVEIHIDQDVSVDTYRVLETWDFHPQKHFWSKGCSSKKKIKMYFALASEILNPPET